MTLNILKTEWVEIKRLSRTLPKPNKRISKKDLSRREVILLAQSELGKTHDALQDSDDQLAEFHFAIYQSCKTFIQRYVPKT